MKLLRFLINTIAMAFLFPKCPSIDQPISLAQLTLQIVLQLINLFL